MGVATVESCAGCHNPGLPSKHALGNQVSVGNVAIVGTGADIVVTYNVKVDGLNRNDYTHLVGVHTWVWDPATGVAARTALTLTPAFTVVPAFNGNYTLTIPGFGATGATPSVFDVTSFLIRVDNGNAQPQATFLAHHTADLKMAGVPLSNQACINCHGSFVFRGVDASGVPTGHHGANPFGVEACVVCHDRDSAETRLVALGTRLMGYVHGIHNSHNMPGATKLDGTALAGGVYYRNFGGTTGVSATSQFSVGFPGFMNNCSTCHDQGDLPTIAATPVSWARCMSCHAGPPTIVTPGGTTPEVAAGFVWAGFGAPNTGTPDVPNFSFNGINHATFTAATDCTTCHADGGFAPATLAGFHNGLPTERAGFIWDAADQSVVLGRKLVMTVTGVSKSGTNLVVTWGATYDGTAVDPCNATVATGPVFIGATANTATGQVASNMSILKAYAQANDWVNVGQTGNVSPGQPTSVTLTTTNTVCSGNVATSTVSGDAYAVVGSTGTVALQGKPQVTFVAPAPSTATRVIQVRAESPTLQFVVPAADGAAVPPITPRRQIVSDAKCLACHLGTLYQHGGNRVDSVALCVTCHNPASNEKNVRVTMGVDATAAYDGKVGQTFDLRTMIHAIHSAGESGMPLVYYRTNGVYFFGSKEALAKVTNWPGTGCQPVAGSTAPAGNDCAPSTTGGAMKNHNFIEVHYPRALNDCTACHVNGSENAVPDGSMAVAVTVDPGVAPWGDQLDDVLLGPSTAACMSCHQSGNSVTQFGLLTHAYGQSWLPAVFPDGRQTLIDAATP